MYCTYKQFKLYTTERQLVVYNTFNCVVLVNFSYSILFLIVQNDVLVVGGGGSYNESR